MNLMASGQQQPPLLSRKAWEDQTTQTLCNSCWLKKDPEWSINTKTSAFFFFSPHESGWIFMWDLSFCSVLFAHHLDSLAGSSEPRIFLIRLDRLAVAVDAGFGLHPRGVASLSCPVDPPCASVWLYTLKAGRKQPHHPQSGGCKAGSDTETIIGPQITSAFAL